MKRILMWVLITPFVMVAAPFIILFAVLVSPCIILYLWSYTLIVESWERRNKK